jgi:hypothetical protein
MIFSFGDPVTAVNKPVDVPAAFIGLFFCAVGFSNRRGLRASETFPFRGLGNVLGLKGGLELFVSSTDCVRDSPALRLPRPESGDIGDELKRFEGLKDASGWVFGIFGLVTETLADMPGSLGVRRGLSRVS